MNPFFAFGLPSGGEWFFILVIALIVFGPKKLPELFRGLGRSLGEFKKAKAEFDREMQAATDSVHTPAPAKTVTPTTPALLPPVYEQAHANAAESTAPVAEPAPTPVVTPVPAPNTVPQSKV